jgi:hypothetical protein
VIKIQCKFRQYKAYQYRMKILKERRYLAYCNRLARLIQRLYRGWKGRKDASLKRIEQANERLRQAKIQAIKEVAAIKIQRVYRGYCGRNIAIDLFYGKQARLRRRALEDRKRRIIQRIVRGFLGRCRAEHRREEIRNYQKRWYCARELQRAYRGHVARVYTNYLRRMAWLQKQNESALQIQRVYRGYRGRLLFAVAAALRILRSKQQFYALEIQRFLRGCMGRYYFKLHRDRVYFYRKQVRCAIHIQRIYRGHKGREAYAIEKELQEMDSKARPLIKHLQDLEEQANNYRKLIARLESMEKILHENLFEIERELEHCMLTTNKYTDSSRINNTPQRFLTKFLKVRLKDHLEHEAVSLYSLASHILLLTPLVHCLSTVILCTMLL